MPNVTMKRVSGREDRWRRAIGSTDGSPANRSAEYSDRMELIFCLLRLDARKQASTV
jgi:hypothetical protein